MFNTSQDLLYIVLSLCVLWFTVFLCWLLYQAARVLKNANEIIENITHKLELITDAIEFIRRKVDSLSGTAGVLSSAVARLVEKFIVSKMSAKMGSQKKKNKLNMDDVDLDTEE